MTHVGGVRFSGNFGKATALRIAEQTALSKAHGAQRVGSWPPLGPRMPWVAHGELGRHWIFVGMDGSRRVRFDRWDQPDGVTSCPDHETESSRLGLVARLVVGSKPERRSGLPFSGSRCRMWQPITAAKQRGNLRDLTPTAKG